MLAGFAVAGLPVAAITALIFPLREISPADSNGVAYLLAVLLVATVWGPWLGLLTSVLSAAAFNFFHLPPTGHFTIADSRHWVALGVFLVAAVVASAVAELARSRAIEAEQRRREADLAAALARILLGGASVESALGEASQTLADALGLESATIELEPGELGFGLRRGDQRIGALVVGAELSRGMRARLTPRSACPSTRASLADVPIATHCARRSRTSATTGSWSPPRAFAARASTVTTSHGCSTTRRASP